MGAEEPLLRVEGVGKAYFSNRVLKNVNFTLGKGRILGLVGENGAGKSTLMNILFGMRVIQETGGYEGKILIDGSEVSFRSPMAVSYTHLWCRWCFRWFCGCCRY